MATTDYGMSTVLMRAMPAIRAAAPLVGLQIDP